MALPVALHPVLALGLLSPSLLVATFPLTLKSGGWGLLLCVAPRMIHSGVPGRVLSLDVPVQGWRLFLLGPPRMIQLGASSTTCPWMITSGGGGGGFCCLFRPGCSSLGRLPPIVPG